MRIWVPNTYRFDLGRKRLQFRSVKLARFLSRLISKVIKMGK